MHQTTDHILYLLGKPNTYRKEVLCYVHLRTSFLWLPTWQSLKQTIIQTYDSCQVLTWVNYGIGFNSLQLITRMQFDHFSQLLLSPKNTTLPNVLHICMSWYFLELALFATNTYFTVFVYCIYCKYCKHFQKLRICCRSNSHNYVNNNIYHRLIKIKKELPNQMLEYGHACLFALFAQLCTETSWKWGLEMLCVLFSHSKACCQTSMKQFPASNGTVTYVKCLCIFRSKAL